MRRRICLLLPCLLLSLPAFAGERYTYSVESQGGLKGGDSTLQILADGNNYRRQAKKAESDGLTRVTISRDGGENETVLLLEDRTYYTVKMPAAVDPAWSLFGLLPVYRVQRTVTGVELTASAQPELEQVGGRAVRRHDLRLSYDIAVKLPMETVRGKVRMEASFWMAEDYSAPVPSNLRARIQTGFPEIDTRLTAELAKLRGLPMKWHKVISTEADPGTPPRSETATVTILKIEEVETPPALFQVPAGFRYEEPVFTGLGAPLGQPQR